MVMCEAVGGGVYYTRVVHNMNNEFTEDKQVGTYGCLSVHKNYEKSTEHTPFQGVDHYKTLAICELAGR